MFLWISALALSGKAFGQNFTTFNVPGGTGTNPYGINNSGAITGSYMGSDSQRHGFVRNSDGTFVSFDPPESRGETDPASINSSGAITGMYWAGAYVGFIRHANGHYISFGPSPNSPNPNSFQPQSINDAGEVTGFFSGESTLVHGFLRQTNGTIVQFDPQGSIRTLPYSINQQGVIVGTYYDSQTGHGFIRQPDGQILTIDKCQSSLAYSINAHGTIAGYCWNGVGAGFLLDSKGNFTFLDPGLTPMKINNEGAATGPYGRGAFFRSPSGVVTTFGPEESQGCNSTYPTSINSAGVVVGQCTSGYGQKAFVRTP
jgi:hypothetical protein